MITNSKQTVIALLLLLGCLHAAAQDSLKALTPKPGPAPRITGPEVFGIRPGHPLLFTVTATGDRPVMFSAANLPAGVYFNKQTGQLTGQLKKAGTYTVQVTARNVKGIARRTLRLVAGEKIALTPPMGWNSWNVYAGKITQELVLANARAMVSTGLKDHGWAYMNIDDYWQGKRSGPELALQPDTAKFPSIDTLCEQVHALGLKIGIYSTPWAESYGHHAGGSSVNAGGNFTRSTEKVPYNRKKLPFAIGPYSFAGPDARQYAAWGMDYLKYDWYPNELPETREMYEALRASGHDIILSLSNSAPLSNIPQLYPVANSWRTGGDIGDEWKSLKERIFSQDVWAPYAGPGHWNDPDMLIVGYLGWGHDLHPTRLKADEQYTHISAWCLLSAPLLLGCDITKMDDFTLGLVTNDEVLAIDQDPSGSQAMTVNRDGDSGVLAKKLADGSTAAGLFNLDDAGTKTLTVTWQELGLKGPCRVRDLWRQRDLGVFNGSFAFTVPQHGVSLIRLIPVHPAPKKTKK